MNPYIPYYQNNGVPATAVVQFDRVPTVGATITLGTTTYTFGTNFRGADVYEIARAFAALVNADRSDYSKLHINTQPIGIAYAVYYGNAVRLIATVPGTAGNSLVLSTSEATTITLVAFSGGATGIAGSGAAPALADLTLVSWSSVILTCDATNGTYLEGTGGAGTPVATYARKVIVRASEANTVNVYLYCAAGTPDKPILTPSDSYVIDGGPGTRINLAQWKIKSVSAGTMSVGLNICV